MLLMLFFCIDGISAGSTLASVETETPSNPRLMVSDDLVTHEGGFDSPSEHLAALTSAFGTAGSEVASLPLPYESLPVLAASDVPANTYMQSVKSDSPSLGTPADSLSSAGIISPDHDRHGLESSTGSLGEPQVDGAGVLGLPSKSPREKARLLTSQPREKSLEPPTVSSKVSSAASSRGGSGTNTPRSRKGTGLSSGKVPSSRHSPGNGQGTPKSKGHPPQGLTAAVSAKLVGSVTIPETGNLLVSNDHETPPVSRPSRNLPQDFPAAASKENISSPHLTLPSPLYVQDNGSSAMEDSKEEGDGKLQVESIYDPVSKTDSGIIKEAVTISESKDSGVARRRARKADIDIPREIVAKPGLDNNNLRLFFKNMIADDTSEIMMNITWGVCNLSSAPSCEVEVGTIISDKGVYLLEVLDPDNHKSRPLSWSTEYSPLAKITCCYHHTLRKIGIGIFDQSLTIESFEKGLVKRFVFFPHTYEKLNMFVENLKAACDAHKYPYQITSMEQGYMTNGEKGFLILNPGSNDMARLKQNLVWSKSRAAVGNASALSPDSMASTDSLMGSYEFEVMKACTESAEKFEIVQYVIVGELSCDILPISDSKLHVQSRALVLTNDTIYLCKEELDSWPHESTSIRPPPFPRCNVLDSHPISRVSGVRVCDKSHPIVSCTDPLYEFAISFEELDDIQLSPTLSAEWVLCVHDRQYLDQLLNCLIHLSNDHQKENQKLVTIKHTSNQLMTPALPKPPKRERLDSLSSRKEAGSKRGTAGFVSSRGNAPCFFSSTVLFEFSVLTNYQRLKFFKKHIAQAEFMKSDEIPLSVFLAHCSTAPSEYVEIEACVLVSNYAIYLLSGVDSIQQWVEMGGVSSFPRKDLLDRKNSEQIRGFYRLWLKEMKQVDVGVFYDCVSITDVKDPDEPRFTIHTENPSATLSFLSALSCVVELHDTVEEKVMDNILSDYDMVIETMPSIDKKPKDLHYVEFIYHGEEQVNSLKTAMVGISPAIARGIPNRESAGSVKILYQQVVLLVEELRIRDLLTSRFYPHLVFLTNYGVYVCLNEASEKCSPSLLNPSKLSVKKWCHIDLLERLHVTSPTTSHYSCYNVVIYLRTANRAVLSSEDSNSLSLLIQNSELLGSFLYHFSLMYQEKRGKQISITRD
jgi:hypothetical protein